MELCEKLHQLANSLPVMSFPFDETKIPENGIYFLFEKAERAHGGRRIVRVGTHTGKDQLRSRLRQHFLMENKDRSIFRKNIGRALLNQAQDKYLAVWELDLTPAAAKRQYGGLVSIAKQQELEKLVSRYIREHFTFAVIEIADKDERLALESKIISTVSSCTDCRASSKWFGQHSPRQKIRESGLWLVNELNKTPLSTDEFKRLERYVRGSIVERV